jgi:hypothetical protein
MKYLILACAVLVGCEAKDVRGKYHYPYKGTHIVCRDGETWQMGAVRYKLKGPVPCTITDPATGKTEFKGVEPDIVVFIQESK